MTKSYLGRSKEIDIDGEKITLAGYSYSEQKKIAKLASGEKTEEAVDIFLVNTVKDWTLVDANGDKLGITAEIFNSLDSHFVDRLIVEATKFNKMDAVDVKNL